MKLIFAGSPEFAKTVLAGLLKSEHTVLAVLTQSDKRAGRGRKIKASPVKVLAEENSIPILQPSDLADNQTIAQLERYGADAMVVVSYGKILPTKVLNIFALGCLNVHASLLPRWRGAAPIHRAIEAGDAQTGVSIMQMDSGLDTGSVRLCDTVTIDAHETMGSLHNKLMDISTPCLLKVLASPDTYLPIAQNQQGVTYANKVDSHEARLDFSQSAMVLERKIRAFNPTPGCWSIVAGVRYKIYAVKVVQLTLNIGKIQQQEKTLIIGCGENALSIEILQPANRNRMTVAEFLNGKPELPAYVDGCDQRS